MLYAEIAGANAKALVENILGSFLALALERIIDGAVAESRGRYEACETECERPSNPGFLSFAH